MSTEYSKRYVDESLDLLMPHLPAMLLDGPKGVGKTSTASQRVKTTVSLDRPSVADRVRKDPDWAVDQPKPILIDEWHRAEPVWDSVKRAVDRDYSGGQFLLTGSLPTGSTHSGAGRITSLRMRPMTLPERGVTTAEILLSTALQSGQFNVGGSSDWGIRDYLQEIVRSGFPAIRNLPLEAAYQTLQGYIDRVVDSDIQDAGLNPRQPAKLRSWLAAYAAATGTTASMNTIRAAASAGNESPSRAAIVPYVDTLTRLRILDELAPWLPYGTSLQRLTVSSKHYLADPALAAVLTGFSVENAITHDLTGALFEHLVALSLSVFADAANASVYHLRTRDGRQEIDFIIERADGKVIAIEAKLGETVLEKDSKHLLWLKQQLGDRLLDIAIVNTGQYSWRTREGVAVIPLALLG